MKTGTAGKREGDAPARTSPSPPVSLGAIALDAARHSIPLAQLYLLGGDLGGYILLTGFDLAIGLLFIVASTRERGDVNSVDPRSRQMVFQILSVLVAAPLLASVSAVVAVPILMPSFLLGLFLGFEWTSVLARPWFVAQLGVMALLAAARFQVLFYERTRAGGRGPATSLGPEIGDLEGDRHRSLADYAAQVTLIATFTALSYGLAFFGRGGLWALPAVYTSLLLFYDARPDLARRILPDLWRRDDETSRQSSRRRRGGERSP